MLNKKFFILNSLIAIFILNFNLHAVAADATTDDWSYLWKQSFHELKSSDSQKLGLLGVVSILLVRPLDDKIHMGNYLHQNMSKSTSHIGDFLGTGLFGAPIAASQYFGWDPANGQRHILSLVLTQIGTGALKMSFGRQRPGGSKDHFSFPSGHTSTMFATATSLAYEYGWEVGVPMYSLAVLTGVSRLADDAHWFSDVVGGAFLGFITARSVHQIETKGSRDFSWWIVPTANGLKIVSHF
jgi:membrane-associated phospholipid phosphatase